MSIDEVIERSRQAGDFSERKRFSVARSRAIQKMRQFALADSAYYILEWIQAAVANGATYLDVAIEADEVRMSYVGGGFAREELEALFDFLFASKDNLDVADVRQLALGVNTLLSAQPESIAIESGDGTLEGTTRVVLDGRSDTVTVGTPTRALEGTFVRAAGLRRTWGVSRELAAIEERCLTATIPILINDAPLFGYSAIRSPDLFGYRRTLKFDEGDLYGTIGIATTPITKNFKLLTWGTWITTERWTFPGELPAMGGVVGYDRLRKTADHASIVKDEVYHEMWARLITYARQLAAGHSGEATFDARMLDGPAVTAQGFRDVVREHGRVVVFDRQRVRTQEHRTLAARYGEAFDAPVFLVGERDRETIKHLGGPDVEVHTPRLDPDELRFYERPVASEPARPWLTAALEVESLSPDEFAEHIEKVGGNTSGTTMLARAFRASTSLNATVYTPAALSEDGELCIELRVARRVVWVGSIASPYPAHHVVADLNEVDHDTFAGKRGSALAVIVAQVVAGFAETTLARATSRVVEALRPGHQLSTAARRIVLGVVCRSAIKRLRQGPDGVAVRFSLESDELPNMLLDLELLETFDGRMLSMRDLEALLPQTCGLVYVAHDALDVRYDRSRVLRVDQASERILTGLLGQQTLVRLGDDSVHASHGNIRCREFAFGVRDYPDFPLLVDGSVAPSGHAEAVEALAGQLLGAWLDEGTSRHVLRHLIWFVVHGAGRVHDQLVDQPLFRTADGRGQSYAGLQRALEQDGVAMYDGWSAQISATTPSAEDAPDMPLAMDPYVFHVLSRIGTVRAVLDVDLTRAEAEGNPSTPSTAFLEREEPGLGLVGAIGIPMRHVDEPFVLWLQRDQGTAVALRDLGSDYGVVGRLVGRSELDFQQVTRRCNEVCQGMYDRLIRRLPSIASDTEQYVRALEVVLEFAERRIRLSASPDGSLDVSVHDPLAHRILDLPVFPTTAGVAVTGWRFLREFAMYSDRELRPGRAVLAPDAPDVARRWLDSVLDPARVVEHPSASPRVGPPSELDRWLTAALNELRTDGVEHQIEVRVLDPQQYAMWMAQFGIQDRDLFVDNAVVYINRDSWLVQSLGVEAPERESASWLLLAVYARINKLRLSVTNVHELHFQSRVLDWLDSH